MNKHPDAKNLRLIIPDELKKTLEERAILSEDVKKVVVHAENSGIKLVDAASGHLIAHCRIGAITLWAEYSVKNTGCILHNAYCHRIQIKEE